MSKVLSILFFLTSVILVRFGYGYEKAAYVLGLALYFQLLHTEMRVRK
ncbi:hypothetical protein [Priestia megaterium]|nr:hypothetical protein [Priestia megaterium]